MLQLGLISPSAFGKVLNCKCPEPRLPDPFLLLEDPMGASFGNFVVIWA